MNLEVLLSSGESDTFNNAADAVVEDNYLHVLAEIEGDEIPEGMKTLMITREIEPSAEQLQDIWNTGPKRIRLLSELPRNTKTQTFQLVATYAPGMWMKVMYL